MCAKGIIQVYSVTTSGDAWNEAVVLAFCLIEMIITWFKFIAQMELATFVPSMTGCNEQV